MQSNPASRDWADLLLPASSLNLAPISRHTHKKKLEIWVKAWGYPSFVLDGSCLFFFWYCRSRLTYSG